MRTVLLLLLAGLGGLLYIQWQIAPVQEPGRLPARDVPAPGGEDVKSTQVDFAITLDAAEAFDVISKRPLFVEGRRPPEELPTVQEPVVKDMDLQGLDLKAVLITPQLTVAWVKDQKTGAIDKVKPGKKIRGWTVQAVKPDLLMLSSGERTAELQLREYPAKAAPAAKPKPRTAKRTRPQRKPTRRTPVQNRNQQRKN